jgi:Family of unknown function (DUF6348)
MHEELVEWATVAYRSNPNATDADIEAVLVHHGFGRRLAWRATAMLTIAFGRVVLKGLVTLPSTYIDGDGEHELETDPVFVAATARASHGVRGDIERIGLRSAEVNAVNAALNAGSKAENLILSSPVLMDPTSGADPDVPGPRDRAQRMVDELRSAHGSALVCYARLFPSKLTTDVVQLQVDFDTTSPRLGERIVRESFAGYGATIEAAVADTIKKFAASSFHVLMATLEAEALGGNQVEWETWGPFRVHGIGVAPVVGRAADRVRRVCRRSQGGVACRVTTGDASLVSDVARVR